MKAASIPSSARTFSAFAEKGSEIGSGPRTRIRTAWLLAAAMVVIALLVIPFLLHWRDPIRRLAALTPAASPGLPIAGRPVRATRPAMRSG